MDYSYGFSELLQPPDQSEATALCPICNEELFFMEEYIYEYRQTGEVLGCEKCISRRMIFNREEI